MKRRVSKIFAIAACMLLFSSCASGNVSEGIWLESLKENPDVSEYRIMADVYDEEGEPYEAKTVPIIARVGDINGETVGSFEKFGDYYSVRCLPYYLYYVYLQGEEKNGYYVPTASDDMHYSYGTKSKKEALEIYDAVQNGTFADSDTFVPIEFTISEEEAYEEPDSFQDTPVPVITENPGAKKIQSDENVRRTEPDPNGILVGENEWAEIYYTGAFHKTIYSEYDMWEVTEAIAFEFIVGNKTDQMISVFSDSHHINGDTYTFGQGIAIGGYEPITIKYLSPGRYAKEIIWVSAESLYNAGVRDPIELEVRFYRTVEGKKQADSITVKVVNEIPVFEQ